MRPSTYFHALVNTFSSAQYYLDILNAKFSFSLRFFLVSYVFLAILAAIFFSVFDAPRYAQQFHNDLSQLENHFPADLNLAWNGQELKTTPAQPITLPYPSFLPKNDTLPTVFGIIDSSTNSPDETLKKMQTRSFFFVAQKKLFVTAGATSWSDMDLKDLPGFDTSFVIDKQSLPNFIKTWQTDFEDSLRLLQFVYPIMFFLVFLPVRFFQTFLDAILIFYFLRLAGNNFTFKKVYQLSLHLTVVAETIRILTGHLVGQFDIPMFSFAFWGYFFIVWLQLRNVRMIPHFKIPKKSS